MIKKYSYIKLKDIAEKIFAGLPPAEKWNTKDNHPRVVYINLKDLKNGTISSNNLDIIPLGNSNALQRYQIIKGDILIACRGTQPKVAMVQDELSGFTVASQNIITIRLGEKLNPVLLKFYLESPVGSRQLRSRAFFSKTQYILTVAALSEMEIPVPPREIQDQLVGLLSFVDEQHSLSIRAAELRRRIMEKLALDLMIGKKEDRGFHE